MKPGAFLLLFLLCIAGAWAAPGLFPGASQYFSFTPNRGQLVDEKGQAAHTVFYYSTAGNINYFFRKGGISFVLLKEKETKEEESRPFTDITSYRLDLNFHSEAIP